MTRTKLFLFCLIATLAACALLEMSARALLSLQMRSGRFLLYGMVDTEKEKHRIIRGPDGRMLYSEAIPTWDKLNPVNRLGFRGGEIKKEKGDAARIVCLGSSTTYGTGLDYEDTYPKLLQDELCGEFGEDRVEVINAGQPGLQLGHILALVKDKIVPLSPDVVILMNVNNNLDAPGFSFVGINEERGSGRMLTLKQHLVRRLALGFLANEAITGIIGNPVAAFFGQFDWQGFSAALLAADNVWQAAYEKNCHALIDRLQGRNPGTRVVLVDEAFNYDRYAAMAAPYEKAREILRRVSRSSANVRFLSVHPELVTACQRGENIWQEPAWDPLHLSKRGNEILAELLTREIAGIINKETHRPE